jgi:Telomeric repeat-binding factor 2.
VVTLNQEPGSHAVVTNITIDNQSRTAFLYSRHDFSLSADEQVPQFMGQPHNPESGTVSPGEKVSVSLFWSVPDPTSRSTHLSYTSSDPRSLGFNRGVVVTQ